MADKIKKLGIIAGQGALPRLMINAAPQSYADVFVLGFEGDTAPEAIADTKHQWLKIEEIARALDILKAQGVSDIVMAGRLSRPSLKKLKPPMLAARIIARLGKALFAGDDTLFKAITRIFEEEGFTVVGVDEILQSLLMPEGLLTKTPPDAVTCDDIDKGFAVVKELGRLDIGQAAIVKHGQVLGVEALEGTDALIKRCAGLGDNTEKGGVLVKAKKPGQEQRVDLPAIGPQTVEHIAAAGFSGVALEAGGTLLIEREKTVALANDKGLFIQGFSHGRN